MRLEELNALSENPNLWDDAEKAQKLMSEKNNLEYSLNNYKDMETSLSDLTALAELAEEEEDEEVLADGRQTIGRAEGQNQTGRA